MSKIWIKPQQVDITQDPGLSPPVAPKEDLGLGYIDANSTFTTSTPSTTSTNTVNNIYITRNGPGGRSGQVQFNEDGSYIGDAGLTYDQYSDTLTTGTLNVNQLNANRANLGSINYLTISGGNNRDVLKTNGSGVLTWASAFPSDVGNSGKFLLTNGVSQQWANVSYANLVDIPSNIATQSYVGNAIANLVDSSPAALNTLLELANAIGNNANYSTTITNSLANKASITYVDNIAANITWGNLSGRPTIPDAQINSDWTETNSASKAFIQNKPTLGNISSINISSISSQILYGNGIFAGLPEGVNLGNLTVDGNNLSSTSNVVNITTSGADGLTQLENKNDNGDTYVWLDEGNVKIEANLKVWTFVNSGELILPLNGNIVNNGNVWGFGSTGSLTLPKQGVINDELVPIQTVTIAFRPSFPGSVDQSPTLQIASGTTSGTLGAVLLHLVNPTGSWVNYNNTLVYIGSNDGTHINLYEGFPGTVFNSLEITSGQFDSGTISVLQSQINLVAGDSQWSFSPNGNLTLPAGGDILDSTGTSVLGNPFDQNLNTTDSPTFDDIEIHGNIIANGSINIYSTEGRDIQIFTDWESGNGVEVWLRHDDGIHLATENGEFTWQFNTDGSMYLPTFTNDWTACTTPALSGGITFSTNSLDEGAHGTTRYANINLDRNSLLLSVYNGSSSSWRFSEDGNIKLPSNDAQIQYANGASILAGIGGTYGNSNVANYLPTYTGNVSANYFIGNGNLLTNITGANVSGQVGNALLAGTVYTNAQPNITSVGTLSNLVISGTSVTGVNSLLGGPTFTPLANTMGGFVSNVNSYTQLTIQNKNTGSDATTDFIATADNGSDTVNYLDMGIINSGYDALTPTNSLGNIVYAADSYIYAQGNTSAVSQSGGNLAIGTTVAGKTVKIFAGGVTASNVVATVANTGVTVTGNVTATKFVGDGSSLTNVTVSVAGNVIGTTSNVSLVAGSFTATFDNTGVLTLPTNGGDEGGELRLGVPTTNTTLTSRVTVDVYQDRFRIFDGSTKGVYVDLSQAGTGVGTLLNNRVSAFVNAGTFVTMDLIKATVTTGGNRGLSLATTTGTFTYNIGGTFGYASSVFAGGGAEPNQTLTTTATSSIFGWSFPGAGDTSTYILTDTTNSRAYRITLQIGASYNNNMISIERLI